MQEYIQIIIETASIWAPSITAIAGVVATVLAIMSKVKTALDEFKKDDTMKEMVDALKAAHNDMINLTKEIKRKEKINEYLVEQLTRVHNYVDIREAEKTIEEAESVIDEQIRIDETNKEE